MQDISTEESDRARNYLQSTKRTVDEATKRLSTAQWGFKYPPETWSICEIIEHLAATEDLILATIENNIESAPAPPITDPADLKEGDDRLISEASDRTHKLVAPDRLLPSNRYGDPEKAKEHFLASRSAMERLLDNLPNLRVLIPRARGGSRDVYGWILFAAAHSERHACQIKELKDWPTFPAV